MSFKLIICQCYKKKHQNIAHIVSAQGINILGLRTLPSFLPSLSSSVATPPTHFHPFSTKHATQERWQAAERGARRDAEPGPRQEKGGTIIVLTTMPEEWTQSSNANRRGQKIPQTDAAAILPARLILQSRGFSRFIVTCTDGQASADQFKCASPCNVRQAPDFYLEALFLPLGT